MKVIEITVAAWNEIAMSKGVYFCNGCLFDEKTDNLIAFGWYEDELHEVDKFYKVVSK